MEKNRIGLKILYVFIGIVITALVCYALLKLGKFSYEFSYDIFNEQAASKPPGKDVVVTIDDGMSTVRIGEIMEEKGLSDSRWLFTVQMKLSDYGKDVKPGTYQLNSSMTPTEMLKVMARAVEEAEE